MSFHFTTSVERDMNTCPAHTHTQTPCEMLHNSPKFYALQNSRSYSLSLSPSESKKLRQRLQFAFVFVSLVWWMQADNTKKKGSNRKCVYSVHFPTPATTTRILNT